MSLRRFHKFWLFEFYNLVIGVGYLTHVDGWGISINWDRVNNPKEGESRFRKSLTLWWPYTASEEGPLAWWPNNWLRYGGSGPLSLNWDDPNAANIIMVDSRIWTGRQFTLRHINWPQLFYWSVK